MPTHSFDLLVIGGGPGRYQRSKYGGDLWQACRALVEKLHEVGGALSRQPPADFSTVIITDASWNLDYECAGD